jgi:D-aspartate ligase
MRPRLRLGRGQTEGRRDPGTPPAVIVGLEANGLGVARALAGRGIACIGLTPPGRNPCRATRACKVVTLPTWSREACLEGLHKVGQDLNEKAPLLITKDEPVLWIAEHQEELSRFFAINLPDVDTTDLLMSKRRFVEWAARLNWPVPQTWFIDEPIDLYDVLPEVVYPCILKPQVKNSAFRAHSPAKAFKCDGRTELIRAYELVAQWEPEVVIQEWIEGGDERVAYCLGYCDRQGEPRALFAGRKLRQWPIECGNTALAEPAPAEWVRPIEDLTRIIWSEAEYRGLGSVEFKMRPASNEPVIMEPTVGRTNYQNEVAVINGVNIPLAAYCDLLGKPVPMPIPSHRPVKLIDARADRRSFRAYHRDGRMTWAQWWHQWRGPKRFMLLRWDDPGPALAAAYDSWRRLVAWSVRRALGPRTRRPSQRRH